MVECKAYFHLASVDDDVKILARRCLPDIRRGYVGLMFCLNLRLWYG